MPVIHVEMLAGRSVEQKREVAEAFTREMARICDCKPQGIHIVFNEVATDNWSLGGQLISDKQLNT